MFFWSALVIFKDCQHIIQIIGLLCFCCAEKSLFGGINFVTLFSVVDCDNNAEAYEVKSCSG